MAAMAGGAMSWIEKDRRVLVPLILKRSRAFLASG